MAGRRAPVPLASSDLVGAARRGVVVTDPGGRPYVTPFLEQGDGQALGADGAFHEFGDVYGDAGAASGNLSEFDGDGYHLADSGYSIADLLALIGGGGTGDVVGPASAVDNRIAVFDGTTGKLIKDGGKTIAVVLSDADAAADAGDAATLVTAAAYTDSELAAHTAVDDAHFGVKRSIVLDADDAMLDGDLASPGADMVYGTDGAGVKGWKADPSGSGGGGYFEPLTDGDLTDPELIFASGDVIMVEIP